MKGGRGRVFKLLLMRRRQRKATLLPYKKKVQITNKLQQLNSKLLFEALRISTNDRNFIQRWSTSKWNKNSPGKIIPWGSL